MPKPQKFAIIFKRIDRRTALEILEVLLRYVVRATEKFDERDITEIMEQSSMGEDIMKTFIDKYIGQGFDMGIQQGEVRILLRQMEARFGKLPRWAKDRIEQADPESVETWSIRLLTANAPEEVLGVSD